MSINNKNTRILLAIVIAAITLAAWIALKPRQTPELRFVEAIRSGDVSTVQRLLATGLDPTKIEMQSDPSASSPGQFTYDAVFFAKAMVLNKTMADGLTEDELKKVEDEGTKNLYDRLRRGKHTLKDFKTVAALLEKHQVAR